jgi:putative molybdopterin biosynthesis protein
MQPLGTITRQDQLATLSDEHRLALLRRLMCGPSTISRLGREFDRHPAWIRYHIKRLESVGLVEPAGQKTTRNYTEKFYRASSGAMAVHLLVAPDAGPNRMMVALGSDDFALQLLADELNADSSDDQIVASSVGSLDGLIALRQGLADVAGCHLFDAAADEYNVPYLRHLFPDRAVEVVTLSHREQGLMSRKATPNRVAAIGDLAESGARFVNRNPGSGTRVWLDMQLRALDVDSTSIAGYQNEVTTHTDVALAVASGEADVGLGIRAAADNSGLEFTPLFTERYDLVFDRSRVGDPGMERLRERLESRGFRSRVDEMCGYDSSHTGEYTSLAG